MMTVEKKRPNHHLAHAFSFTEGFELWGRFYQQFYLFYAKIEVP